MSSWPRITVAKKGLFVFLLDQSGSMENEWVAGKTRANQVATIVNKVIFELMMKGENPAGFRDRFDLLCIGYGSSVGVAMAAPFSDLAIHSSQELRDVFSHNSETIPNYVVAKHDAGGTNMSLAFEELEQILPDWVAKHADSAPPIIFHITDAENTGADPKDVVDRIKNIRTSVHETLVWNIFINNNTNNAAGATLVKDPNTLTDPQAKFLVSLSSQLPNIPEFGELAGHYALAYDVSPKTMLELLRVGSLEM